MKTIGIYSIKNKINGHQYIGSSICIESRWKNHRRRLSVGTHVNKHLQSAWDKYGSENFEFSIIEKCNRENLIEIEQFFIDKINPEYNIRIVAERNSGLRHSPETIQLLRDISKGKGKGRKLTEEHKKNIGLSSIGRNVGKIRSGETRKKISESRKGKVVTESWLEKMKVVWDGQKGKKRKPLSNEGLLNIRNAAKKRIGRKASDETKNKMRESHKKSQKTSEQIMKLANLNKGRKPSQKQLDALATGSKAAKEKRELSKMEIIT